MSAHPFAGYIDELAAHLGCDQQHIADACAGREYLRRELVDPACAFLKSRKVKVKAADIDPLGRVYTPAWLADEMARIAAIVSPNPRVAVDPGCGGGSLLRAARRQWPGATLIGMDLDPLAEGLKVADRGEVANFLRDRGEVANFLRAPLGWQTDGSAFLVNPPYDKVGMRILKRAVDFDPDVVVGLVPLPWLGLVACRDLLYGERPATAIPVLGRPWDRLREAVILVWRGSDLDRGDLPRCVERPKGVRSEP